MDGRHDIDATDPDFDNLVEEFLRDHGIFSVEDAPDELLDAAHEHAEKVLGRKRLEDDS